LLISCLVILTRVQSGTGYPKSGTMSYRQYQAAIDLFRSKTIHFVRLPVKKGAACP